MIFLVEFVDNWKTIYFPQVIHDDGDVDYMFRLIVEK